MAVTSFDKTAPLLVDIKWHKKSCTAYEIDRGHYHTNTTVCGSKKQPKSVTRNTSENDLPQSLLSLRLWNHCAVLVPVNRLLESRGNAK